MGSSGDWAFLKNEKVVLGLKPDPTLLLFTLLGNFFIRERSEKRLSCEALLLTLLTPLLSSKFGRRPDPL
jgi:hypothetical protein